MFRVPLLLMLCSLPTFAFGADLDVPSIAHPDITAALVAAGTGDRILVDASRYNGEIGIIDHLIALKGVTIEGINGRPQIPGIAVGADLEIQLKNLQLSSTILDIGHVAVYRQSGGTLLAEDVWLPEGVEAPGFYLVEGIQAELRSIQGNAFRGERAVEVRDDSTLLIRSSSFVDNDFGAVLASAGAALTLEESTFRGNFAGRGADVEVLNQSSAILRSNNTFSQSRAQNGGGSLYVERSSIEVSDAVFTDVSSDGPGGLLFATMSEAGFLASDARYSVVFRDTEIAQTTGVDQGGALLLNNMDTLIEDVTFRSTTAADADLTDTNRAEGGAIAAGAGLLTVRRTTFTSFASPEGNGGAIAMLGSAFSLDSGEMTVEYSDFYGDSQITETGRGGAIDVADASATLHSLKILDVSTDRLGGGIYVTDGSVHASKVDMERVSTVGPGGAYRAMRSDLNIADGVVKTVSAPTGALVAFSEGEANTLTVTAGWFEEFATEGEGAGILVESALWADLRQNRFCGGNATQATSGQTDGAVVQILGGLGSNSEFTANLAVGMGTGMGAILRRGSSETAAAAEGHLDVLHNTLLETSPIDIWEGDVAIRSNIFGHADLGVHVGSYAGEVKGDYNLWWEIEAPTSPVQPSLPGANAVYGDPELVDYSTGNCAIPGWLSEDSPARDAADPNDPDPDGGTPDIGVTGGAWSILDDADFDGFAEDIDCDDFDADTYPGAPEDGLDGIDHDCDGVVTEPVTDADGDGTPAAEDCNDDDPAIHPLATDIPGDDIDQDCSGEDANSFVGSGCSHAPLGAGSSLLLVVAAMRRRSRD
ncbi:MAG: putative metal-binding motif-containing protein [Proteobacteria bacterium]|nr:putative metal-binding motif-containing protein [Pseudomonadota bacterium]